jgi:anti-repressor protein
MININTRSTTTSGDYVIYYTMSEAAKLIGVPGMGRTNLYKFLKQSGIIMGNNEPYQQYIEKGYFKYVVKEITNGHGKVIRYEAVTLASAKGIEYIKKLLTKKNQNNAN